MKQNATITATYLLQIPITGSNSHSLLKLTRKESIYFYLHSKDNKQYNLKSYLGEKRPTTLFPWQQYKAPYKSETGSDFAPYQKA